MEYGRDILLYGLSFLLLMEWLLPLPYVTDTGYIHVFVLLTAVFFFITFLQLPVILSMVMKSLVICYGLYLVFFEGPFFSVDWLFILLLDVRENIELMINGGWYALTDTFRSFLFFVLLAIMSYLLFYWTVHARRILFFLLFTIVYVTVIDTFTIYDASFAIIRTFVIGFLLLGLVTVYRMIEQQPVYRAPKYLPIRLAALLVMMIGVGGLFGFISPKFDPQWEDPVPFVRAAVGMNTDGSGEVLQRIGYGDNDERLGGGFIDDNSPVFYAAATREHYWRGETKDFYTGRGWETTTPEERKEFLYGEQNAVAELEQLEAEIAFVADSSGLIDHLLYPGELLLNDQIMNADLFQDAYTERASTYQGGEPVKLENYQYTYLFPSYQIDGLRSSSEQDPQEIREFYTQLPEDLPERVRELAVEITSGEENRYDRAKAVETFFSDEGFSYETQDVPVPVDGQDYVDQFLFETRRGYCDNFSTSMIVLLRALDIPARWVKGYTQGEVVEVLDDSRDVYKVTNGNAHSWVEVYFPGVGWVPFEPTRGFDSTYEFVEPEVEVDNIYDDTGLEEETEPEVEDAFAELEGDDEVEQEATGAGSINNPTIPGGSWMLAGVLVAALVFAFLKNKRIVQYYTLQTFSRREDEEAFLLAYDRLLWLLEFVGWKRKNGETLREYAVRIDKEFDSTEMMSLTVAYEQIAYGGQSIGTSWTVQKPNWIAFVRKIDS